MTIRVYSNQLCHMGARFFGRMNRLDFWILKKIPIFLLVLKIFSVAFFQKSEERMTTHEFYKIAR